MSKVGYNSYKYKISLATEALNKTNKNHYLQIGIAMQLSIIIVNYKSWQHLTTLLTELKDASSLNSKDWEIIVVDNASNDGRMAEFEASYANVQFIENSGNNGFAHANNVGAQNAKGEYLLFMNPDVIAAPTEVAKLLDEKISHPEIGILSAQQLDKKGRLQKSFDRFPDLLTYFRTVRNIMRYIAPKKNPNPRKRRNSIIDCDWISGSLLLLSRNNFELINGWNEDYWMYAEDMDLCKKAANFGLRRAVTPIAEFVHFHGGASRSSPEVTLITKSEVMKSAHVYVQNHFTGSHGLINHCILVLRDLSPLLIAGLLNIITFGQITKLQTRYKLLQELIKYYRLVAKNGSWLSERSVNFPLLTSNKSSINQ